METASGQKGAQARSTTTATVGTAGGKQENSAATSNSCSPEQSQEKYAVVSREGDCGFGARSQGVTYPLAAIMYKITPTITKAIVSTSAIAFQGRPGRASPARIVRRFSSWSSEKTTHCCEVRAWGRGSAGSKTIGMIGFFHHNANRNSFKHHSLSRE